MGLRDNGYSVGRGDLECHLLLVEEVLGYSRAGKLPSDITGQLDDLGQTQLQHVCLAGL